MTREAYSLGLFAGTGLRVDDKFDAAEFIENWESNDYGGQELEGAFLATEATVPQAIQDVYAGTKARWAEEERERTAAWEKEWAAQDAEEAARWAQVLLTCAPTKDA